MEDKTNDEPKLNVFEKGEISIRKNPNTLWWHIFDGERDVGIAYLSKIDADKNAAPYQHTWGDKYVGEQPWNKDTYHF